MVGTYLKKADQFIKAAKFDMAEREVGFALKEEPTNVYALAYRERIHRARMEYENELRAAEERRKRDDEYRQKERELAEERMRKIREGQNAAVSPSSPGLSGSNGRYDETRVSQYSGGKLERSVLSGEQQFREILSRSWRGGIPSDGDLEIIDRAQIELGISLEDRIRLIQEVKAESYINAIKVAWRQQQIVPTQPAAFEEFRRRYGVTAEEHLQWEARILFELQVQTKRETIFYVDDDIGLAEVVGETLRDAGYKVVIATSPEQALQQLRNIIPDLILCDVRFPNSEMSGLSIYEAVRKMPQFVTVPFLFLSAVIDEHIMHAGLGSGADDYITKPFNPDTLLAVIEGKIKRYREIKRLRA